MNKGLRDNPLERMKVLEFPGTDFNLMGIERIFYETKEPIENIEETPSDDNQLATDYVDSSFGEKLKKLFSTSDS